jgi:photosystem II stability/assembly factor-like uncharacterized protein
MVPAVALVACGGGSSPGSGLELTPLDTSPPTTSSGSTATTAGPGAPTTAGGPTTVAPPMAWNSAAFNLVGLSSDCGNVSIVARPDQDLVISFVNTHGLFSMPSAGTEWAEFGRGGEAINNRMAQLVVDPANPEVLWESGPYGWGIFRSDDNGASFRHLGDLQHVDHISIDFNDPERRTILAGGHESTTVWRSTDAGRTWEQLGGLPADAGFTASPYLIDANTYLVGSYNGASAGVYRSTDAGATWEQVFSGPVVGPVVDTAGKLRWLRQNGAGVITSTDQGATWTERAGGGVLAHQAGLLLGLPDGSVASWSPQRVVISPDDGQTWRGIGPVLPYEPKGMAYSSTGTFFVSRDECDYNTNNDVNEDSFLRLDPA